MKKIRYSLSYFTAYVANPLIARLRFYFFHLNLKRRLWLRSVGMTLLFRVFPCRILGSKPLHSFFILELIFSWDA
jgi:hypothetical protein